jgi:hypothetical protein
LESLQAATRDISQFACTGSAINPEGEAVDVIYESVPVIIEAVAGFPWINPHGVAEHSWINSGVPDTDSHP